MNDTIKWIIVVLIVALAVGLVWLFAETSESAALIAGLILGVAAFGVSRMSARPALSRRQREKMI